MGLLDALTFLTRIPLPGSQSRPVDLVQAAPWFPVVGALLGASLMALLVPLAGWTSALTAVVLVIILEQVVTGALHLDGLADVADGLGGRDVQHRLAIMKDHATGVYGTAAVTLVLLLQVALLTPMTSAEGLLTQRSGFPAYLDGAPTWLLAALVGAAAWSLSRAAMLPVAVVLPYAREQGTGASVIDGLGVRHTLIGSVLPVLLTLVLGIPGLVMLAATVLVVLLMIVRSRRLFGGATGDVLGATAQLALPAALLGVLLAG